MSEDEDEILYLYLEVEDVLLLYAELLECTKQEARDQLRDANGLESALMRAPTYAYYQQADLAYQAAALTHGIAEGLYFIDGNKRIAHAAMRSFLLINGYTLTVARNELARWILELSHPTTEEPVDLLATRIRAALDTTQ